MTTTLPTTTLLTTALFTEQTHHPAHLPYSAAHRGRVDQSSGSADRKDAVIRMPSTADTHGPADDVLHERAEHGLRRYTTEVAAALGSGPEATWCEWADAPSAYIALEPKMPGYPDRDTALTWSAEHGWAVTVETGCGEDLLITASLDGDVLPAPHTVATWARAALEGRHTNTQSHPSPAAGTDLTHRVADWASHDPTLDDRTK